MTNEVHLLKNEYELFLKKYRTETFINFQSIESREEYAKIQAMLSEIEFICQKNSNLLNEAFNPEQLKENFQSNCRTTVSKFDMMRQTFAQQNNQKELEKLKSFLTSIMDLDKHFEHTKKIQAILMEIGSNIHDDLLEELKNLKECL
jgi:hypothetical protein